MKGAASLALLRQFLAARSIVEVPSRPLDLTGQAEFSYGEAGWQSLAATAPVSSSRALACAGEVRAKEGFLVIATQNPREFVATSHLSEALMDRMEWVQLQYQSFDEERAIAKTVSGVEGEPFLSWAVALIRMTRSHPKIKRGASIRAAIALLEILAAKGKSSPTELDFWDAAKLALPTRIEMNAAELDGNYEQQVEGVLRELLDEIKKKPQVGSMNLSH